MKYLKNPMSIVTTILFLATSLAAAASDRDIEEETERAQASAAVLKEIMSIPENEIPEDLLDKAEAIAVIPHTLKGAFVVGGQYGKGLIAQKKGSDWGTPAFIQLGGASVGFQIGASATDYVLIFTNREGLDPLLKGKVKLGGDASVAAGPVGRTASASTDVTLNSSIYSYSRSKGAFAGISLDGAVLTIDDSANEDVYGKGLTGKEILLGASVAPNDVTTPFVHALNEYVR